VLALTGHVGPVMTASLSRDGARIVSGGYDTNVRVWDARTGDELLTLKGHRHPLSWAAFTPDGARVVSWDRASVLRVWGEAPSAAVAAAAAPAR
jgi:WD40 repeat protein